MMKWKSYYICLYTLYLFSFSTNYFFVLYLNNVHKVELPIFINKTRPILWPCLYIVIEEVAILLEELDLLEQALLVLLEIK